MKRKNVETNFNPNFTADEIFNKIQAGVFEDDLELLNKVIEQAAPNELFPVLAHIKLTLGKIWPGHKLFGEREGFLTLNINFEELMKKRGVEEYFSQRIRHLATVYNVIKLAYNKKTENFKK
jgi:hypothetical protein